MALDQLRHQYTPVEKEKGPPILDNVDLNNKFTPEAMKALFDSKTVALPAGSRPPPTTMLLLHAYEACHGTGCPLAKARIEQAG